MKREWYKKGAALSAEIQNTIPDEKETAIWYIGQCGFVYKYKNTVLYIDPVLTDIIENGQSIRLYESPFAPEEAYADYMLCTHGHLDHLQPETARGIYRKNPKVLFLVPGACVPILRELSIPSANIVPLKAKCAFTAKDFSVFPVSAAHPEHETDENGENLALSYQLTFGDITFLHTGDTYLTDQLLNDYLMLPAPDVFFPPINGGDYFRTRRNCIGNVSYLESAALAAELKANLTIPMHFDMISGNTIDPCLFLKELWKQNPAARFRIPALGELIRYRK